MPFPQPMPDPGANEARMPLPKVSEEVQKPVTTTIPSLCLERQPFHILDALRQALPELGRNIARAHYILSVSQQYNEPRDEDAKQKIRQLSEDPDAVSSHEPWWHEYGIVTHSENVIDVARNKWPQLADPRGDLAWAIEQLARKEIDGLSQLELLIISLPLHDLGKFQPVIKTSKESGIDRVSHTGHEARGGDMIAAARSANPPPELEALSSIFNSFAITGRQLDYIEQCVRLHYEFGKVRDYAKTTAAGYSIEYTRSAEFTRACNDVAAAHTTVNRDSTMSLEKGVLFLFDSAGKTDFKVQNEGDEAAWEQHVTKIGADPKLIGAYRQYHVNIEVGLRYLQMLRSVLQS